MYELFLLVTRIGGIKMATRIGLRNPRLLPADEQAALYGEIQRLKEEGVSLDSVYTYLQAKGFDPETVLPPLHLKAQPQQDILNTKPGIEHIKRMLSGAYSEALIGLPESPLIREELPGLAVNLPPTNDISLQLAEAIGRGAGFVFGGPGNIGGRLGLKLLGKLPIMANLMGKVGVAGQVGRGMASGVSAGTLLGAGRALGEDPATMMASAIQEGLYMGALGALPIPPVANKWARSGIAGAEMGLGSAGIQGLASMVGVGEAPSWGEVARTGVIGALQNLPITTLEGVMTRGKGAPRQGIPLKEVPPKEAPPKEAPPKEAPPKEAPPKEAPPKEVPPKEAPPKEVPPKEAPPKEVPPIKYATTKKGKLYKLRTGRLVRALDEKGSVEFIDPIGRKIKQAGKAGGKLTEEMFQNATEIFLQSKPKEEPKLEKPKTTFTIDNAEEVLSFPKGYNEFIVSRGENHWSRVSGRSIGEFDGRSFFMFNEAGKWHVVDQVTGKKVDPDRVASVTQKEILAKFSELVKTSPSGDMAQAFSKFHKAPSTEEVATALQLQKKDDLTKKEIEFRSIEDELIEDDLTKKEIKFRSGEDDLTKKEIKFRSIKDEPTKIKRYIDKQGFSWIVTEQDQGKVKIVFKKVGNKDLPEGSPAIRVISESTLLRDYTLAQPKEPTSPLPSGSGEAIRPATPMDEDAGAWSIEDRPF